jgi:hypothetical protein
MAILIEIRGYFTLFYAMIDVDLDIDLGVILDYFHNGIGG